MKIKDSPDLIQRLCQKTRSMSMLVSEVYADWLDSRRGERAVFPLHRFFSHFRPTFQAGIETHGRSPRSKPKAFWQHTLPTSLNHSQPHQISARSLPPPVRALTQEARCFIFLFCWSFTGVVKQAFAAVQIGLAYQTRSDSIPSNALTILISGGILGYFPGSQSFLPSSSSSPPSEHSLPHRTLKMNRPERESEWCKALTSWNPMLFLSCTIIQHAPHFTYWYIVSRLLHTPPLGKERITDGGREQLNYGQTDRGILIVCPKSFNQKNLYESKGAQTWPKNWH